MAGFDVEGARAAGYTDTEIAGHLAKSRKFDLAGAQKVGYSEGEIINHLLKPAAAPAPAEPPKMGLGERVVEAVTGEQRSTNQTETLPDWATMPELNSFSMASFKTGLGTLLSNPQETVQIIKANFPGVQVAQDDKGNFLLTSSIDGKQYAIKPGFRLSDVPRAAGAVAAFTPAGRAATLPGLAAGAGATQAVIEATQSATGGEFNPGEVGAAALLAPVLPAAVNAVRAVAAPVKAGVQRALGRGATEVPPAAAAPVTAPTAAAALSPDELAQTARSAANGGIGSSKAMQTLAEQAAPNPKTVEAAKRLGVEEYLQPDHVTTNQAYRELAQAVKSTPGSATRQAELQGLQDVAKRADDLIAEVGGTTDVSALNTKLRSRMMATVNELEAQSDDLYQQVRKALPIRTEAPANNVLAFLRKRAGDLNGADNLSAMEKGILRRLTPRASRTETVEPGNPLMPGSMRDRTTITATERQPTYALLDDVRRDVGAVTKGRGPFKDADTGLAKQLYALLSEDQSAVVGAAGLSDIYNAARSTVGVRKALEDDMVALFGKHLDSSIASDLSGAMGAAARGDSDRLVKLLQAVPPDLRQNVVASGLNSVFAKNARSGNLNFNSYATWFEGLLRNKQAYAAVMSNLPQPARKQLSDLYRVSRGISQATRERITTGRIQAVQQDLQGADTLLSNLYGVAKRAVVGIPAEAATSAVGFPGAGIAAGISSALTRGKPNTLKAADALISSPEFLQAARAAGTPAQPAAARALAKTARFRSFVRAVGSPRELSDPERWLLGAMQASRPRTEQQEQ